MRKRYLIVGLALAVLLTSLAGVVYAQSQGGSVTGGNDMGSATDENGMGGMMGGSMMNGGMGSMMGGDQTGTMMEGQGMSGGQMMGSFDEEEPFDSQFIDQMTMHHEGAIMSSEHMIGDSERPELRQLAENIQESQSERIEQMQAWREE